MLFLKSNGQFHVRFRIFFCFVAFCMPQLNIYAGWYLGGANLNLANHYFPGYVKLGSSEMHYTTNGISLDGGYKFRWNNFLIASEFDVGSFFDADGNVNYLGCKHYVNSTYYLALKQKLGLHIKPNFTVCGIQPHFAVYGILGLSLNSIGDRVYTTDDYFNKKQISYLYGGGLEYYSFRFRNLSLFSELFYFTPTSKTLYSGGANVPHKYSLSVRGSVFQLGMRYYFDC